MTIDEAIKHCEEVAELNEECTRIYDEHGRTMESFSCKECATEHRQLAEWLKELEALRDFANFVAESVMEEDFKESCDFYAEVFCRKLYKMGCIEATDNKWIFNDEEVNDDVS